MKITIQSPDEKEERDSVLTWWYKNSTLIIEYDSGETELFPQGNVVGRPL